MNLFYCFQNEWGPLRGLSLAIISSVASCTQQKKIEELEAQLQEAEDIVKDLREELRAIEAEPERFPRSKQVRHHVQVDNASIPEPPVTEVQPNSKSQRLYNSLFTLKKSLISNGDLLSIILRSKETKLYRNGCTQRIRACERTPPEIGDTKPESIVKEDEVVDKLHITPSVEEKQVVKEMDLMAEKDGIMKQKSTEMEVDPPLKSSETKLDKARLLKLEEERYLSHWLGPEIDGETCNYVVSKNRRSIEVLWVSANTIEGIFQWRDGKFLWLSISTFMEGREIFGWTERETSPKYFEEVRLTGSKDGSTHQLGCNIEEMEINGLDFGFT
ncbi:unnamed protein product [Lactuca saligna]|uniref:Uncharacterized protein n=1 Tax=Lactuca saligna TaxID=75948 RepID=A0AA36E3R7_LACSI|nr:unnamed protein product [Lactuca saligna]